MRAAATSSRIGHRVRLGAGLGALALVLRAPTFVTRFFDPDEAAIGVQAMVVRAGGTLYADIFDRKPPLPPLAYAASFAATGSNDLRPLRVMVTVGLAATGILVALDARRRWGPKHGWWAGVLLIVGAMSLFPADAGGANYAHFALLPGTAAMLWSRRARFGWGAAAGIALGAAVLCRQSWLLAFIPACYSAWRSGRARQVALLAAGFAGALLTVGFYAPLAGFWRWNVTSSPGFVFAGTDLAEALGRGALSVLAFAGFHITAVAGLVVAFRTRNPLRPAGAGDRDLWLWLLTALAAVAAGLRFFGHYWLQALPPVVVLATPVVVALAGRAGRAARVGLAVPAVVAFALLFVPGSFHGRPDPAELAGYVRAHTSPDDRVFVWGSFPEVLLRADRLPAGGLVHSDFVTGRSGGREDPAVTLADASPEALRILLRELTAHPPELVLDTSTAADLGYTRYPLEVAPDVAAFVRARYAEVAVIDGVTVLRRVG